MPLSLPLSFHTKSAIKEVSGHISSLNNLISAGDIQAAPTTTVTDINANMGSGVDINFDQAANLSSEITNPLSDLVCQMAEMEEVRLTLPDQFTSDLKEANLGGVAEVASNIEDWGNESLKKNGSFQKANELAKQIGKTSIG